MKNRYKLLDNVLFYLLIVWSYLSCYCHEIVQDLMDSLHQKFSEYIESFFSFLFTKNYVQEKFLTSALYAKNLGSYIENFFQIEAWQNGNKKRKMSHTQAEDIPYFNVDQLYEHISLIMNNN